MQVGRRVLARAFGVEAREEGFAAGSSERDASLPHRGDNLGRERRPHGVLLGGGLSRVAQAQPPVPHPPRLPPEELQPVSVGVDV